MSQELYARRGVSSGKEEVHQAISGLDKGLYPKAFCKILPDYFAHSPEHCALLHVDTAGTKPALAYLWWRETGDLSVWRGIVQDALVMNFDDMACAGVVNGFVVSSNIARNKFRIPGEVVRELIQGCEEFLEGLRAQGIDTWLAGGETADVGDILRTLDVGYTVAARMPRSAVVVCDPQPGDVIVGLASYGQATYETAYNSGIGCNGLTSARHDLLNKSYAERFPESFAPEADQTVVYNGRHALTDTVQIDGKPYAIGQLALSPTRTYLPVVREALAGHREQLHAVIHCTGGGQTKCLHFAGNVHIIKDNLLPIPPVFQLIQEAAPTAWHEMFRTFNMGHRLEFYTDPETAQALIDIADRYNIEAQVVGKVMANPSGPKLSLYHEGQVCEYGNKG